jgi:hypothetical protein
MTEAQKNERPPFPAASVIAGLHIGSGDCCPRSLQVPSPGDAATREPLLVGPIAIRAPTRRTSTMQLRYARVSLRASGNSKVGVECGDGNVENVHSPELSTESGHLSPKPMKALASLHGALEIHSAKHVHANSWLIICCACLATVGFQMLLAMTTVACVRQTKARNILFR